MRPPVLNGHFRLAVVVAAQKRLYCGGNCIIRERSAGLINHVEKSLIIRSYTGILELLMHFIWDWRCLKSSYL